MGVVVLFILEQGVPFVVQGVIAAIATTHIRIRHLGLDVLLLILWVLPRVLLEVVVVGCESGTADLKRSLA